jgi:PHAX RNA-binding domain
MEPREPPQAQPTESTLKAERKQAAKTIAHQLGETEKEPLQQIHMIVKIVGPEQALAFLNETLAIEAQGGQLLTDGSRRRTPGGVFFHLIRTKGPEELRFPWRFKPKQTKPGAEETQAEKPKAPATKPAPPLPAFTWEDRLAVLQELRTEKGAVRSVKITLIGRPGKMVDKGSCIVTVMQAKKAPALPKGLPVPPATTTTYVVYIAAKQWKNVSESLADPEDVLIVEGFPQVDDKTKSLAVFATNVTTKKLQMARRPAPREAR